MAKSKSKKRPLKKSKRRTTRARKTIRKVFRRILKARSKQARSHAKKMTTRKRRPVKKTSPKKTVPRRVVARKAPAPSLQPVIQPAPIPQSAPAPSVTLHEGDMAPDFRLQNDEGQEVSLSGYRGRKVVLYSYPKDDTPGCTKEACSFRDGIAQIQERGAVVLGLSTDSVESHKAFKEKYNLNFPLLADVNKDVVQKYGIWKEKNMYGRTYMGIERTTFLINEEGRIERIFPKVDVEVHYQEVLDALGAGSLSGAA